MSTQHETPNRRVPAIRGSQHSAHSHSISPMVTPEPSSHRKSSTHHGPTMSLAAMMANVNVTHHRESAHHHQQNDIRSVPSQLVNMVSTLFPYHASQVLSMAQLVEIIIPHVPQLTGALIDLPPTPAPTKSGRTRIETGKSVYLHLPPFNTISKSPSTPGSPGSDEDEDDGSNCEEPYLHADIRDQLTSMLDLVSEFFHATELVLVLKRDEREDEELRELLHALAYVGGGVLRRVKGGFEFDDRAWVLVGIEV